MSYGLYRMLTSLAGPFAPMLLKHRLARGKEDAARLGERLGVPSKERPPGRLLWLHAASVGEANTVLPLIETLLAYYPHLHILLTTVTVTSASLMEQRLPARAIHQFAPLDIPTAVEGFIAHWKPDVALWVDSEFWPNLMVHTQKSGAVMGIVNARMSERSFRRWHVIDTAKATLCLGLFNGCRAQNGLMRRMLSGFSFCFAQTREDADRLVALGLNAAPQIANLKYDAQSLPCDEGELASLREAIGARPVWVAASTHPGEEALLAPVHVALALGNVRPLTIIVPRHANRGAEAAKDLSPLNVARRSLEEPITQQTDIYLADTMGELGLFYRLSQVAFIGGTLVAHGGQNPLEPARLACPVIAGPHMENFAAIAEAMQREGALKRVADARELAIALRKLFEDEPMRAAQAQKAQKHVAAHAGALALITRQLQPYLA